ncbi:MAG: hypothetical protein HXY23_01755 [Parvularculaceae bacterium]|nr:hypothetical protein [Parvularculaceae bacterium]
MKKSPSARLAAICSAVLLSTAAYAGSVAPCPDDYRDQASAYMLSRLAQEAGARVQVVSEPYLVRAEVSGHDVEGWAVDLKVKARQASGVHGVYLPYTVIFVDGAPVALCQDTSGIERV